GSQATQRRRAHADCVADAVVSLDTTQDYYSAGNNHGHACLLWLRDNSELTLLGDADGKAGWNTTTKSKALLYDGAGEALRDGETIIHGVSTFAQLASIEGCTLRAPEGEHDDRAVAFALALAGRIKLLRWHASEGCGGPCLLTAGWQDPFGGSYGPNW